MRLPARLPPPLRPGDTVGVAALSGPVDPERLACGLDELRRLGYEPVEAENLAVRRGFLAGSDTERLEAFHRLASDPEIKAIVFARGGYGVPRLLPEIDWELLARTPRAYVGYSDLTPFLLQVVERLGFVAFHGPMVAADMARGLEEGERESLLACLEGRFPQEIPLSWCESGPTVEGPLLGGCLSLLVSLLGTPWAPDLEGALLFLEEVAEPAYRFDRMLTHLRLSGNLTALQGLIVGHLTPPPSKAESSSAKMEHGGGHGVRRSLMEEYKSSLEEIAARYPWPLARGLEAGHEAPNRTLPMGCRAVLEPAQRRLLLLAE